MAKVAFVLALMAFVGMSLVYGFHLLAYEIIALALLATSGVALFLGMLATARRDQRGVEIAATIIAAFAIALQEALLLPPFLVAFALGVVAGIWAMARGRMRPRSVAIAMSVSLGMHHAVQRWGGAASFFELLLVPLVILVGLRWTEKAKNRKLRVASIILGVLMLVMGIGFVWLLLAAKDL